MIVFVNFDENDRDKNIVMIKYNITHSLNFIIHKIFFYISVVLDRSKTFFFGCENVRKK